MQRPITSALFVAYLLLLLDLTLVQFRQNHPPANFKPFHSIRRDMRVGSDEFVVNFVGNLVAFLPFGVLLPLVATTRIRAWHVLVASTALSAAIESVQYFSGRRVADVDDVILNVTSALLGYAAYAILRNPGSIASRNRLF